MRNRAQGILAFVTILATCVAAILQLSAWTPVAGACVLSLISISNHHTAYYTLGGGEGTQGILLVSSALNATATAFAAFAIGRGLAWLAGI